MKSPRVSVVMPAFNSGGYLAESAESILNQTFSDFEFIIINDGSTDGSEKYLTHLECRDYRVVVISRENKGITATLNEGLKHAKGEYIARMDADDIALPERFSKQIFFLDNHPEYVAVGSRVLLIDSEGLPICPFSTETEPDVIDKAHLSGKGGIMCHPSLMIRRDALNRVGGYNSSMKYAQDLDLLLNLGEIGQLTNLPEILTLYRMHPKSIGNHKRLEQYEYAKKAVVNAHKRRGIEIDPKIEINNRHNQATIGQLHQKWAWWALKSGNHKTSRKHAIASFREEPTSPSSWKVLFCSLRGF